ncbi:MAG: sigma-54-dependent Fis family transcriptional regulator [Gammaproteobacteria bacterium]|nr:sigma-54-dependent Fis family transcriptional regulator [Gammaproteobacteria bacterium]
MMQATILVVEDDLDLRDALNDTLVLAGYSVIVAQDGRMALDQIERQMPTLVVTDIQMPRMNGHVLLKHIKKRWPDLPVMLMTAYGTIQKAVEAMRDGAVDYLTKPFEAEVLVNMVGQYVNVPADDSHQLIATDEVSKKTAEIARRVAITDATVLIAGESGSGKEVLARYIHLHSPRSNKPFIAINCAAIPHNMLEATLFGYEKGAFTGAYKACPGKFELADGGTILLDEISEMDLALQAKLLRVLQEREVERLGGNKIVQLDVRVLATSNRNMREEVSAGNFREDLFYRLNVFPLYAPPLRERPNDIVSISSSLILKHLKTAGVARSHVPELEKSALQKLLAYDWPGNVRELDNVIQRALILQQSDNITAVDIQYEQDAPAITKISATTEAASQTHSRLEDDIKSHEYKRIMTALQAEMGNRKAVAEQLGISQRTLRYKLAQMREQGISVPDRYGTTNHLE